MASFQLSGIAHEPYADLFQLSDHELAKQHARRVIADAGIGFPCRISLSDASAGDELLLLPYEHLPTQSPYRAAGPIFVRRGATRCVLPMDTVPPYVSRRLMSLRAYDGDDLMQSGDVVAGDDVAATLARIFEDHRIAYVHLHNAGRGCFSCTARRA
ncbi:MAG: DUF1203 domain-containing protein [Xanthomonadales bacterium]|nr:DUF1203 domain-containing protein [Xanthomonadales bacterium]